MRTNFAIHVARTQYKFSCAHMTVFPDGSKERLHGHNYFIALTLYLSDISFKNILPFQEVKDALGALCQTWKEHTLVAAENPFFEEIRDDGEEYEFKLCGKRYVLPREDVMVLPIDNVAVEPLAFLFAKELAATLKPVVGDVVVGINVEVSEVPGQGASAFIDMD